MKKKFYILLLLSLFIFQGCTLNKNADKETSANQTEKKFFNLVTEENCRFALLKEDVDRIDDVENPRFNTEDEALVYIKEQGGEDKVDFQDRTKSDVEKVYIVQKHKCNYRLITDKIDKRNQYPEGIEFNTMEEAKEYIHNVGGGGIKGL